MNPGVSAQARAFLSNFRGESQSHILQFCEEIWRLESDVCVFMARKAAALVDCLREVGLTDVRGIAVNDRVLDTNLGWTRGRRITLIDDCVFSGTTLHRAKNKLQAAGCSSCDVLTLSVNYETLRPELLPGGSEAADLNLRTPLFELTDTQCVHQCYEIVRAIASYPRPYDVDFPYFATVKIDADAMAALLQVPGWEAFDLSSRYQLDRNVRVYTLIPDQAVLLGLMRLHGHSLDAIQSAKLRVYARQAGSRWSVKIVPICMLACLPEESVSSALAQWLKPHSLSVAGLGLETVMSEYRLLTYAVSLQLYFYFMGSQGPRAKPLQSTIRTEMLDMSFAPGFATRLGAALISSPGPSLSASTPEPSAPFAEDFDFTPVTSDDPVTLAEAFRRPFAWLYRNRELGARQLIRSHGLKAVGSADFKDLNRLLYGFSPASLFSLAKSSSYDTSLMLTLLIDKYVDMGIAVPTNVQAEGAVYRAFRHGEDAVFGEAQERLAFMAIAAFLETSKKDGLWGLELQKVLVLFIQVALRNSLLDRVDTSEAVNVGCRVVSVKGHLHGPIPVLRVLDPSGDLGPPFIEGLDTHPLWLVESWVMRGFLVETRNAKGKFYRLGRQPDMSIGERPEASARSIGRTLAHAMLLPKDRRPLEGNLELVMLSTCAEPDHQARALSGELRIFLERWPAVRERIRQLSHEHHYDIAHRELRTAMDLFTAVNSGSRKYRWYVDGTFKDRVGEIAAALSASGRPEVADYWRQMWPEALSRDRSNTSAELQGNIDASGGWLITATFSLLLIDFWLVWKAQEEQQGDLQELRKLRTELGAWCGHVRKYGRFVPDGVRGLAAEVVDGLEGAEGETVARWSQTGAGFLENLCREEAIELTESASLILSTFARAKAPVQGHPYALFLDLPGCNEDSSPLALQFVQSAVSPLETPCFVLPSHHNPFRRGVWVLLTGNRASDRLCSVAKRLAEALASRSQVFRIVAIGQLNRVDSVRSKLGSPVLAYGNFFRRIVSLKEEILSADYDSSLTVVSEWTSGSGTKIESERDKFARFSRWRETSWKLVQSTGEGLGEKTFEVGFFLAPTHSRNRSPFTEVDIGILTVLPVEARAVRSIFRMEEMDVRGVTSSRDYDLGTLQYGSRRLRIAHTQVREAGASAAISAFRDLIEEVNPQLVCIAGVAGSIAEKAAIGDVIVARSLIHYDRRKVTEDGVGREALVYRASTQVVDLVNAYFRDGGGRERRSVKGRALHFKVHFDPIGCGEAVVADEGSEVRKWLLAMDRKTAAVEMESAAVAHALWELGESRVQSHGIVVVRGISDLADKNKRDDFQFDAASNAARVLRKLLIHFRRAPVPATP